MNKLFELAETGKLKFQVNRTFFLLVSLVCVISFFPNTALSCPKKIGGVQIAKTFTEGKGSQQDFIKQLKKCLPGNVGLQEQVDSAIIGLLTVQKELSVLPRNLQKSFVDFNLSVLKINAEAGFASSQHNYAAVHNAEPGSLLFRIIPVNYHIFAYWTRKAAAQREPRALFNLAVRLASKKPTETIKPAPETAYIIFPSKL